MQFLPGASVLAMDGQEAGHIHRVVIDPKTKEVTYLVIHIGVILTHDKVVPVNLVEMGEQGRAKLQLYANQLAEMPDFEETHYRPVNEEELERGGERGTVLPPAFYWYPPYPETPAGPVEPPYVKETSVNIPKGTVAVHDGAEVLTRDGKSLGHVERVLTNPETEQVTHFLVSHGQLRKERKLVPMEWVDRLDEDQVYLAVGAQTIQNLPMYR